MELPEDGDLDLVVRLGQVAHHLLEVLVASVHILLGPADLHDVGLLPCGGGEVVVRGEMRLSIHLLLWW